MKKRTIFLLLTVTLVFGFNGTKLLRAQVNEKDEKLLELQKEIKTYKSLLEKLTKENKSIKELEERINLLEKKLKKLKIEIQEINPLITDATKNWGKGFYLGSKIENLTTTLSAEVGYNINLQKEETKKVHWINRLGLAIGFMSNQQKVEE